jgi:glycosyltransferase involved in cell wall biosynthesis
LNEQLKNQVEFIKSVNAFDKEYYLSQFIGNDGLKGDLIEHYCISGCFEGKNPSIWFNTDFYLNKYKDVKKAGVNPFFHYLKRGFLEKREVGQHWLDIAFYQDKYLDIIPDNIHPYTHYLSDGLDHGLIPTGKIDGDSVLNKLYLKKSIESLSELEYFITNQAVIKTEQLDCKLYGALYSDLGEMGHKQLVEHYQIRGKQENRLPNFEALISSIGFEINFLPIFDLNQFYELNPLLSNLTLSEIYLKLMQYKYIDLIRFSYDDKQVMQFYAYLGEHYLVKGQKDKAKQIFLYANYIKPSTRSAELIGNIYLDSADYAQAKVYYLLSIELGGSSLWLFNNTVRCLRQLGNFKQALECLIKALSLFPEHSHLLKLLYETLQEDWDKVNTEYQAMARLQHREKLIKGIANTVDYHSKVLRKALTISNNKDQLQAMPSLNGRKVLIIGDYHVPQCVRYRIVQKQEQLLEAGYEVSTFSWTDINQNELNLSDIIIVYRAPALPPIVQAITKAKLLGKIVIYEIDDLIFDIVYPADYSEYAGAVSINQYGSLTHGMALFNAAARLCDYAIASTEPLQQHLAKLVSSGQAFVHRNGLDFNNTSILDSKIAKHKDPLLDTKEEDIVTIFYGSGTLAHNTDFIEIALPAIEKILQKYSQARFMVVGHLTLPKRFVQQFKSQLIQEPKTKTIDGYWTLLAKADINLAVLEVNEINNCKSELKWFEAACFKTPSVVSATKNYLDIVSDKENSMIATTPDDWFKALDILVQDKDLRTNMGQNAYNRVVEDYSVPALARNIDDIIQNIVAHHGASDD